VLLGGSGTNMMVGDTLSNQMVSGFILFNWT
jgi:hypothetical protein